jgi:hypothetical protein
MLCALESGIQTSKMQAEVNSGDWLALGQSSMAAGAGAITAITGAGFLTYASSSMGSIQRP